MGYETRSFPQNRGDRSTCQANDINTSASTAAKNVLKLSQPNESRDVINPDVTPIAKNQYTHRELGIAREIEKIFWQDIRNAVICGRGNCGIRNCGGFRQSLL